MTAKMAVTVVRWYELVKYLRIGDHKLDHWSGGFFKTVKDARADARKTPHFTLVRLSKMTNTELTDFVASKKSNCFCIIVPRSVALDPNSETTGRVLSENVILQNPKKGAKSLDPRLKKKTTC